MGRKLTKQQKTQLKLKHKKKKIKKLESLDSRGISRKKYKLVMKPKTFFILKGIGVVAIPVIYFVYSPFLILVMFYFIALFFLSIATEHNLNKSVIRSNHIKIPKYDSGLALILVCMSLFGSIFSSVEARVGMFANTWSMKITEALSNFGSLLTGKRSIFSSLGEFGFGTMGKPEGFLSDRAGMMERMDNMAPPEGAFSGFAGRPVHMDINMDDIPIEFMFSQLLSTVATVLIISTGVFALISLYFTIKKIKKFNQEQNEVIIEGSITILNDEEIFSILDFGEIEEE